MFRFKNSDILIYLIIALLVIIPIFDKYIFLVDSNPQVDSSLEFYGKIIPEYGGHLPFDLVSMTIPEFQKILLFLTLFLSGYSMHIIVGKILLSRTAQIYAVLLYVVNPFVYVRILMGHWYISYAVLPLLLKVFIDLLEKQQKKEMVKFVFFTFLVAFNIHMLIIALIIMSTIFTFWSLKYRDIRNIKIVPAIIIFILLNFYWIFPLITAKGTLIDNIGEEDYKVFTPKIDNLADLFNIASMYGFWREGYIYAKDFIPYWQLLSLFIILLAIYGFISFYQDEKIGYLVKALGVIWIIGFILATGINGPFGDINHWLYDNTILKGFRDSHKFVAMIVFAYAILGGLGLAKFEEMRNKNIEKVNKIEM